MEDRSVERIWKSLDIVELLSLLPDAESLVPDLDKDIPPAPPGIILTMDVFPPFSL